MYLYLYVYIQCVREIVCCGARMKKKKKNETWCGVWVLLGFECRLLVVSKVNIDIRIRF